MNKQKDRNRKNANEPPRDSSGERKAPAKDAGEIIEIHPVDTGDHNGAAYLLEEETSLESLAADEHADAAARRSARHTENEDTEQTFRQRQGLSSGGRSELKKELEQYHSKSPQLSAGDLDADWQSASASGEETVGGTAPTPGQDTVSELGKALGITYDDNEPLNSEEKMVKRDEDRWELDPASAPPDDLSQEPTEKPGSGNL